MQSDDSVRQHTFHGFQFVIYCMNLGVNKNVQCTVVGHGLDFCALAHHVFSINSRGRQDQLVIELFCIHFAKCANHDVGQNMEISLR